MCNSCNDEYTNILDRRFHAQPVACNNCGPHYSLYYKNKIITNITSIISTTSKLIEDGRITKNLRDVTVSGLTLETLLNIDAVSDDIQIEEPGSCGKRGQSIPVDNGGPKLRVKEMLIGGLT